MNQELIDKNGLNEKEFLASYDITQFDQPSVTVDIVLLTVSDQEVESYRKVPDKSLRVLLIKRNAHPFISRWALPGGFVGIDEDIESAAYRELQEETSVDNVYLEQLYTYGDVDRDPRGRIISTSYMSLVNQDDIKMKAGTDAEDARWFDVEYNLIKEEKLMTYDGFTEHVYYELRLTNEDVVLTTVVMISRDVKGKKVSYKRSIVSSDAIAFDHGLIIQYSIERLRNKLEYTDIVFHLMPELFTLTKLQKTYEKILDKDLLKANFRRKIAPMVIKTDKQTSDAGHRPSRLYKYNPRWQAR